MSVRLGLSVLLVTPTVEAHLCFYLSKTKHSFKFGRAINTWKRDAKRLGARCYTSGRIIGVSMIMGISTTFIAWFSSDYEKRECFYYVSDLIFKIFFIDQCKCWRYYMDSNCLDAVTELRNLKCLKMVCQSDKRCFEGHFLWTLW